MAEGGRGDSVALAARERVLRERVWGGLVGVEVG